ncbi:hypothetical protein JNM05_01715 [bacterium]|nr:hypothetical protein [bacterium]
MLQLNKEFKAAVWVLAVTLLSINGCTSKTSGSSSKQFDIIFVNNLYTDIALTLTGEGSDVISPGDSVIFTLNENPGSFGYTAETSGETSGGTQIGLLITWNYTDIDVSTLEYKRINLILTSSYFFMRMRNNGSHVLSPIYVNYGLTDQTMDNISIPFDNVLYNIGYYRAFSNTQVRGYWTGTTTYAYWDQGTHFTFPGTNNQMVTFVNTSKIIANQPSVLIESWGQPLRSDGEIVDMVNN